MILLYIARVNLFKFKNTNIEILNLINKFVVEI